MCDDSPDEEHAETYVWPVITAKGHISAPSIRPTPTSNTFGPLANRDDDDDKAETVKALSQLTSHVKIKPSKKSKRGMSLAQIAAIAKQVNTGKIRLPDLDLENNSDYECCWALVDSGAGVNCAKADPFSEAEDVEAPPVYLTTASGSHTPTSGAMRVETKSKEGIVTSRVFYKAPVDMPILSVTELTKEGLQGSTAGLRQHNG